MTDSNSETGEAQHAFRVRRATRLWDSIMGESHSLALIRAALVTVFGYLLVAAWMLMETTGLIAVSLLVLASLMGPLWIRLAKRCRRRTRFSKSKHEEMGTTGLRRFGERSP